MKIYPDRIHQIMRYAVAVAATQEDGSRRELGPIHLVKYVYLADVAHAEGSVTFTGLPWRFHHFGPWATEAREQVEPAMALPSIQHRPLPGRERDDGSRWSARDSELAGCLEEKLPAGVIHAVRTAVREFANDTSALLHRVYRTPPMLRAAPGESLDFSTGAETSEVPVTEPQPSLSESEQMRRKAAHDALRDRFQEALAKRRRERAARKKPRPPRYDEIFARGQEWLDSLAGPPIKPLEGELVVSEEIWKSPTRSEPTIP